MCKEKPHTLFIIKMIKKKNTSVISTLLAHGLLKTTQSFNGWLYTERFLVGTRLWHIERGLWLHNRNNISSGLRLGGEQTLLCRAVIECAYFQIQMYDIVSVQEGHAVQDLLGEPYHIFFREGLVIISHALIEDFTAGRAARMQRKTQHG